MSSGVKFQDARARRASKNEMRPNPKSRQSKDSMSSPSTIKRNRVLRQSREEAKWKVEAKWAPPRRLTDAELAAARRMFFELDKDSSGSIDEEELSVMLRSLGQNPTQEEVKLLIKSVDDSDDGKIQLREFLALYTRGLDTKAGVAEVNDCFAALGGDTRKEGATVESDLLKERMLEEFGLDVDLGETFGVGPGGLHRSDFEKMILTTPRGSVSRSGPRGL